MITYEEKKEFISKMNVIDDGFFHKVAEDEGACEEIIRIILGKEDIRIVESQVQRFLRNLGNRSVILDALCQDERGNYLNIEIQKKDTEDHQRRVRLHGSNIDTLFTETASKFKELPDVYVIYICNFDIFGADRALYHMDRVVRETGKVEDNGFYELYANTKAKDGTRVAELLDFLTDSTGENEHFPRLSNRVRYFKEERLGVNEMGSALDELLKREIEKKEKKMIIRMHNKGLDINEISDISEVSVERVEEIIQSQEVLV